MVNNTVKVDLSSKSLGEVRKKAIKEAYIPTKIRNSCTISVNSSGEVIVRKKK